MSSHSQPYYQWLSPYTTTYFFQTLIMDSINHLYSDIDKISVSESELVTPEDCLTKLKIFGNSLRIITQNIRSIYKNFDCFLILLARLKINIDIIILTECWLVPHRSPPTLEGYEYFQSTKLHNQNDGIVIYTRQDLKCAVEELCIDDASCVSIKIGSEVAVLGLYRSPSFRNTEKFFSSLADTLPSIAKFKNIVLMGDINIDIKPSNNDKSSEHYLNLLSEFGLMPAHTLPTRLQNCLDHVILNKSKFAQTFVVETDVSDHYPVILNISNVNTVEKPQITRKVTMYADAIKYLATSELNEVMITTDPEEATNLLINKISKAISLHTSTVSIKNKQRTLKPWMTLALLRCIRHRNRLHKKCKSDPENNILSISYKRYRNYCTILIRKTKNAYDRKQLEECANDPKKTWDTIKIITNMKKTKTQPFELLSHKPHNEKSVIDNVNMFFINVGQNLASKIDTNLDYTLLRDSIPIQSHSSSFVLLETDLNEVCATITNLKNVTATGTDEISSKFLKMAKHLIAPPLTYVVNLCFTHGVFPNALKKSIVHPVHKNGDRDSVNNYRPISILPVLSKILEKLINVRLSNYLERTHLLSPCQYGFRAGKSTEDAVYSLTRFVTNKLDKRSKCIGIFLDLAKAFDTVSIPILLEKMLNIGIRGVPLQLFTSYLTNRYQRTKIGETFSEEHLLNCGVPQGSILGPNLFLIYLNELCMHKPDHGEVFSFADDTALVYWGETWDQVRECAEKGLQRVIMWLRKNQLSLNLEKTKYIKFSIKKLQDTSNMTIRAHTCNNHSSLNCLCTILESVKTIKYLGVTLDNHMNWGPHIDLISARIRRLIFTFKNLRYVVTPQLMKTVYFALAQSVISYCILVWGCACKTKLIKVERAQRSLLKVMSFKTYRHPTHLLYKQSEVLTVRQLFIQRLITKQHISTPYDPTIQIIKRKKTLVYKTQKCNTSFAKRHSYYLGPFVYNKLNRILDIYNLNRHQLLKTVREWLLQQTYDTTESFLLSLK